VFEKICRPHRGLMMCAAVSLGLTPQALCLRLLRRLHDDDIHE